MMRDAPVDEVVEEKPSGYRRLAYLVFLSLFYLRAVLIGVRAVLRHARTRTPSTPIHQRLLRLWASLRVRLDEGLIKVRWKILAACNVLGGWLRNAGQRVLAWAPSLMAAVTFLVVKYSGDYTRNSARALRQLAAHVVHRHRRLIAKSTLLLFEHLKERDRIDPWLRYVAWEVSLGRGSPELLVGAIDLALRARRLSLVLVFGQRLIAQYPTHIGVHQQAGIQCFLAGEYGLAETIWGASAEMRERLLAQPDLVDRRFRILGHSWLLAIGHIAHIDTYLKHKVLSGSGNEATVVAVPPGVQIPNRYLLEMWARYVDIRYPEDAFSVSHQELEMLQDYFWSIRFAPGQTYMFSHAGSVVQNRWEAEGRPSLLTLSEAEKQRGRQILSELGVPRDAWFVCLHVREPGFHKAWHQKHPGTRNANIETYYLAIKTITSRGGYVVRLGDPSMAKLPPMPGVVDFAHSDAKSEFMDVFLCAECQFFIGTNSGLGLVPPVFGVPCALTNWSPIALPQWYPRDMFIPKMCFSEQEQRLLSFEEMFSTPIGWSQFENFLRSVGIRVIDNSPEEINDLVLDMLERVAGELHISPYDEALLQKYNSIAVQNKSYLGARIGPRFLRKYQHCVDSVPRMKALASRSVATP